MTQSPKKRKGLLFALSAPSGAGKTTVAELVIAKLPGIGRSISHTTRPIRKGETDGVDYHFVSNERFDQMVENGEFLEWANVHQARYGTSINAVKSAIEDGQRDLLLVIDVQGARTLRNSGLDSKSIFLMPPSMEELERRLRQRGTDCEQTVKTRMKAAVAEMRESEAYDYMVINDDLNRAVEEMMSIIKAERNR